ncbi:ABC transporter permease [Salinarimonas sp.]|uniref:ABC transporter permease n=1 Tax=Salinarimonas sp. TaxID=2766526 RepID=UPI0032D92CF5
MKASDPTGGLVVADPAGTPEPVGPGEIRESAARERREALRAFLGNWQGVTGLVLVTLFFAGALFAPWLAPYDPNALDIPARLSGPSLEHLAGTDQLGRDTFSRLLYGGRVALKIAAIGVSTALAAGLVLGMLAGFGPRWLDNLLLLAFDTVRAFPTIVLALATVALTGPSLELVLAIVIVTSIPQYARVARTATLSLRNTEFILAERSLGAGLGRILRHHVMPNVIGPLLILAAMDVPVVVTVEAGLSFLGLGVLPPTASWGTILNEGYWATSSSATRRGWWSPAACR